MCAAHDPARAEARRLAASKAGRARPNNELAQIKVKLLGLADDVLAGTVDRADAAVVSQVLNVFLRSVEIQRRTSDLGELMARLEAVEDRADRLRGV